MRRDLEILKSVKSEQKRTSVNDHGSLGLEPIASDKDGYLDLVRWVPADDRAIVDGTDLLIAKEHRPTRSPYL